MKNWMLPIGIIFSLAGCGMDDASEQDSSPVKVAAEAEDFRLHLLPQGIQVPGETVKRLPFGSDEARVRELLDKTLGEAEYVLEGENCEDPPLRMLEYSGNVMVHFKDKKMVGWGVGGSRNPTVGTPEGIRTGSELKKVETVYDLDKAFFPSPMGTEYTTDRGYSFFVLYKDGEPKIIWFYAGAVCFR